MSILLDCVSKIIRTLEIASFVFIKKLKKKKTETDVTDGDNKDYYKKKCDLFFV